MFAHGTSYRITGADITRHIVQRENLLIWRDNDEDDTAIRRCIKLTPGTMLRTTGATLANVYSVLIEDMEEEFTPRNTRDRLTSSQVSSGPRQSGGSGWVDY